MLAGIIAQIYVATFNRAPDAAGLDYWVNDSGLTIEGIAQSFFDQPETQALYPEGTTDTAFVTSIYTNLFNRAPDADGLAYWVAKLTATETVPAEMTRDVMIEAMKNGATGTDATIIANKATVGLYVSDTLDLNLTNFSLAAVTADAATVTTVKATADTYVPKALALTTAADTLTGSLGNDTITADILTLGATDSVVDSSSTDADVMNVTLNSNVASTTTITKIETLNVTALGAVDIDMTKITGVKALNTTGSTGDIDVTNAASVMSLGFNGSTTNDIDVTYTADALSGTADKLVVNANTATGVIAKVNAGFESAELNVTGTTTVTSITAPGATAITIAGTGNVTVADNGLVSMTDVTITNTGLVKLGDIVTTDLKSLTATANTGGITGNTAVTASAPFSSDVLEGASTGLAVLTGSGADNLNIKDQSATGKSSTIKLGAGNDLVEVAKGTAGGFTYIFGEAGDDQIKLTTTAAVTSDYIDGGEGTDTLILDSTKANNLTLNAIENITLTGAGSATTTINTNSGALAVTAKLASMNVVDIVGLTAGSTVTTAAATSGAAFVASNVTVGFAATEAASTLNIAGGMTGALTTSKITNVTANLGAASDIASAYSFTAATDVTINATGALSASAGQNVVDAAGTDTLKNFTATGSNLVKFGTITSTVMENVNVTAATALTVGNIGADSEKLDSVILTATAGALAMGNIGKTTSTNTLDVTINAKDAITVTDGDIESTKLGNVAVTSTAGALEVGAVGSTATTIGDITLTAKGDVVAGLIGHATEVATSVGTIAMSSTDGKVDFTGINTKDSGGITVNLTAKTFIDSNGSGTAATIENVGGNITATLAGAAAAAVNYTATTSGLVTLTASNTGGLTSTITNAGTAAAGEVSSITLGNAGSGKTNAVTLNGTVDTYNVTGGTGNDTVAFGAADTIKNGTFSLGAGTADTVDFSALAIANTGANAEGLAMNFSSSTVTFGEGYANVTTLASGKVAAYDSTYFAGSTTAANKAIIADGQNFTLSGVEVVVGSAEADYIALSNTGMTVTGGAGNDKIVAGAGTDIIDMTGAIAGLGSDSVSSFAIATDTFKFTGENIGDGNTTLTFTKAAAASAAALSELNVFTTALADDAAVIAAIQTVTSTTPSLFVVYNTADGEAQVWYDASASADGGETQLVSLVGVTAADIDNITVSNFVTLV